METWIVVGLVLVALVVVGLVWARRSPAVPPGPPGFGATALDAKAALALLEPTALLAIGSRHVAEVPLRGAVQGVDAVLFDLRYAAAADERRHTVLVLQQDGEGLRLPAFSLRPQSLVARQPELRLDDDVNLGQALEVRYQLSAPAQGDVQLFFGQPVREALEGLEDELWLEAAPGRLVVLSTAPLPTEDRAQLVTLAERALQVVRAY